MKGPRFFLSWPGAHLREIGAAAALGAVMLTANLFWQPSVQPFMPAELDVASPSNVAPSGMIEEETLDFIFRPLFLTSRRPLERIIPDEVVVAEPSQQEDLETGLLDGYQLLGVFSSGDRGGVILLDQAKQRLRLLSGDSLGGWVLESTDLRSARFRSPAGGTAVLELAVASTLPLPEPMVRPKENAAPVTVNNPTDAGSNDVAPPAHDGPVTFESIAARQKQEMEAKAKAGNP